jgi:post-segregation antitoxin (ccd killing protein)
MTRQRRVNLTLNEDLVRQAKGLKHNLSAVDEQKRRLAKNNALAATIATWNDFNSKLGSFSEEYSPL